MKWTKYNFKEQTQIYNEKIALISDFLSKKKNSLVKWSLYLNQLLSQAQHNLYIKKITYSFGEVEAKENQNE